MATLPSRVSWGRRWDELLEEHQAIFRTAVFATMTKTYNANIHDNAEAIQQFQDQGVTLHDTPQEYYEQFIKDRRRNASPG